MRRWGKQKQSDQAQARIALLQAPGSAVERAEYVRRNEIRDRAIAARLSPSDTLGQVLGGSSALELLLAARKARADAAESICADGSGAESWLPEVVFGVDGATTLWQGDLRLVPALMPALFDKLVVNLSRQSAEAHAFVGRVARFAHVRNDVGSITDPDGASQRIDLAHIVPLVGQADRIRGAAAALGHEPDFSAYLLEGVLRAGDRLQPVAELVCDVRLTLDSKRLGATTKMRPRTNERVAELSFWGLLDWTMLALQAPGANQALVRALVKCLVVQCEIYGDRGLPQIRDAGVAPYEAFESITGLRMAYGAPLFDP
jgi:hypothetical protein